MRSPVRRFVVSFFLLLLLFSVIAVLTNLQNHLGPLENGLAAAALAVARWAGSQGQIDGNLIDAGGVTLLINHECTGLFVLVVLASFLLAFPGPPLRKIAGIAIGVIGLTLVNVLRIATLVRVVEFRPELFEYFHEYVWQGVFLLLTTLYAMAWVERTRP